MKIVTFADFHLGHTTYSKINPKTGLYYRVENELRVLDNIVDYTLTNNIGIVVLAGDANKNPMVSDTIRYEFNKRITKLAKNGVKVLILDGNHDVSTMLQYKSPLAQFDAMGVENVIHTRFHKEYIYEENEEKIKFVFIPTYHTQEEVKNIVENTVYEGFPIVYIMHGTIRGALLNDWLIEENEEYVEPDVFDKPGVAAVVLGHLHKHQILRRKPLIYYTGSTNRIDFTEENQEKGFVVLEVNPDCSANYEFIEVDTIKFFTLKENLINIDNPTEYLINKLNENKNKVENSILRIRVDVNKNTILDDKKIYQHAYQLGASYVLNIQKQFEIEKLVRIAELTESINEEKALELYYKDKENKEIYIKTGKEIIKKLKEEGKIS